MTNKQWSLLKEHVNGLAGPPLPAGFIIDSPWLPNWAGMTILDYFTNDHLWLKANLKVIRQFPDVLFLPGFWSEFGMCTEPSAFGARCKFPRDKFPHAYKIINSADDIAALPVPDPSTDGLLPFMLNRLKLAQPRIEEAGHHIYFAVARGPLNIASYLMGMTEFLTAMMLEPEKAEDLVKKITEFLKAWINLQMKTFPSIDGILLLDDIIGFIGEREFLKFGLPYFKELYDTDVSVKFLHNDAPCRVSAPYLPEIGVNLFNMGFDISLSELQKLTDHKVTLLGNIPPRDVLAGGTSEEVAKATVSMLDELEDYSRIIVSCGGGMPPEVRSGNLQSMVDCVRSYQIK